MQCPFCKAADTRVIDSRLADDGALVRRRRECERCASRFTTFERAQLQMPSIVKRGGNPEPFSEDKLRRGVASALYKRPVKAEQLDHAIEAVKRKLRFIGEREVPSRQVGEWVMDELRDLDHVAYVRFASIYRAFSDVNAFREEIDRLVTLPTAEERRSQLPLIPDAARRPAAESVPETSRRASSAAPEPAPAAKGAKGSRNKSQAR